MKQTDLSIVYLCTRRQHQLLEYILRDYPTIASAVTCVGTSAEAMRALGARRADRTIVFTNNIFHRSGQQGADGHPEHEMTGAKLARLIKDRHPGTEVYLLSELVTDEPVFDATFKRDLKTGKPCPQLQSFLETLEAMFAAA